MYSAAGKVTRLQAAAIEKQPTQDLDFEYAGIDDHYFMAVALKPGASKVTYQTLVIPAGADPKAVPARNLVGFSLDSPAAVRPMTFYIGPKDFDTLAVVDRDLVKAINFGMFSILVVPLLRSLNWIHSYVGNYGWSILLLTVFINMVLFPLNHKSVVSMRKMQEIQPETKAIQERYAKLQDHGSRAPENEHGADGALPRARREPRERLYSDPADPAGLSRVLRAA